MKNFRLIGIITLAAVIVFSMIACGDGGGGGSIKEDDSSRQTVTYNGYADGKEYTLEITEVTSIARYAAQSGDAYKLTVGGKTSYGRVTSKTANGELKLTSSNSTEPFTVTVSANAGITKMDGKIKWDNGDEDPAPKTLTGGRTVSGIAKPPEQLPDKERWSKWEIDSTATLVYSFEPDGALKIIIGGTPQVNDETDGWGFWRAAVLYTYTAKAGISYEYKFEAWMEPDPNHSTRILNVEYYDDWPNPNTYLNNDVTITTERKTYTVRGQKIPKSKVFNLGFRGADQLGTFYVKMISITP